LRLVGKASGIIARWGDRQIKWAGKPDPTARRVHGGGAGAEKEFGHNAKAGQKNTRRKIPLNN